MAECRDLVAKGYKEVTLLGQNVDSYRFQVPGSKFNVPSSTFQVPSSGLMVPGSGFRVDGSGHDANSELGTRNSEPSNTDFADLLALVAEVSPTLRVRYSTSHPKDMTDKVLAVMARYPNICNYIHLPVQSGSSEVLKRMNRGYTREWYLERIAAIRRHMPDCAISTDIITGFCGETEEDHQHTLRLLEEVRFDMAYMFKYSERPKTLAARKYPDDVPEDVKARRLQEVIAVVNRTARENNLAQAGEVQEVLIEGVSKRSDDHLYGRNDRYTTVILPKGDLQAGDFVRVRILSATAGSLQAEVIARIPHPGAEAELREHLR
jgi:tRNA-2-methylthio-N6-dimethylallyladenosine synthase